MTFSYLHFSAVVVETRIMTPIFATPSGLAEVVVAP